MLIGICGLIGSGKDTIADYLVKNNQYHRYSWASPLKDITSAMFGWDREMIEGTTPENRLERDVIDSWWSDNLGFDWSPRIAMQKLGTDVLRNSLHSDIWILAGMRRIQGRDNVVIPDTRFTNEINIIRKSGGKIWHVYRGAYPKWYDELTEFKRTNVPTESGVKQWMKANHPTVHESEYVWHGSDFDQTFDNSGDFGHLHAQIDKELANLIP